MNAYFVCLLVLSCFCFLYNGECKRPVGATSTGKVVFRREFSSAIRPSWLWWSWHWYFLKTENRQTHFQPKHSGRFLQLNLKDPNENLNSKDSECKTAEHQSEETQPLNCLKNLHRHFIYNIFSQCHHAADTACSEYLTFLLICKVQKITFLQKVWHTSSFLCFHVFSTNTNNTIKRPESPWWTRSVNTDPLNTNN